MEDDFKTVRISKKRRKQKDSKFRNVRSKSDLFDVRCPMCQFPFIEVKETEKLSHLEECKGAKENAEECPEELNCQERNLKHYFNFCHYKLAISRSHSQSELISKNTDTSRAFTITSEDTDGKSTKKKKLPERLTSLDDDTGLDNFGRCAFIGQIIYCEETITTKTLSVNYGSLNSSCEMCNKNRSDLFNTLEPCVDIKCSLEVVDKQHLLTVKCPVQLNIVYNELGWKKISVEFISGFEIGKFQLRMGRCCHLVEMECTIGKENMLQNSCNTSPKTLAFFDFASLGLNNSLSPEKCILEKIWLNDTSNTDSISENYEKIDSHEMSYIDDLSCNTSLCPVTFSDCQDDLLELPDNRNCENTGVKTEIESCEKLSDENIMFKRPFSPVTLTDHQNKFLELSSVPELDKNDIKEKWKNLFKKKNNDDISTTNTTYLPDFTVKSRTTPKACPHYKRIPGTSFAVDAFQYGVIPGVSHYFLTHFHSDHYCGLTKKFKQRIICSSVTAALTSKKLYVEKKYLYIVKHMETFTIGKVKITPLDANHCPGSFMFLFQLDSGKCYLHVGDFRANSDMETYSAFSGIDVDTLYLDTTYCNPCYEFPTQEDVVEGVVRICLKRIRLQPSTLIVSGAYTIGKEKVFMGIANALNSNIWAPKTKRDVLKCLRDENLMSKLVEHPCKARVHVWPMTNLNYEALEQHLRDCNKVFKHVLAFCPSGWNFRKHCVIDDIPAQTRGNVSIISVPYSEHSSYNELRKFVKFLRPGRVVPTVSSRNQSYSAIAQCCTKWLTEPDEKVANDRQQKLTSFFTVN